MRTVTRNRFCILVLLLALAGLAGCGGQTGQPEETAQTAETAGQAGSPLPDGEEEVVRGEEIIRVSTPEELLEAIRPGAEIVLEPGYYDLSEYAETARAEGREFWQAGEEYVQLRECFDGTEIVIRNADDLILRGGTGSAGDTELVVRPRYAAVLGFENCNSLTLLGLTMGHTDQGECAGSVLRFSGCTGVELEKMDLYGCGVWGVEALEGSGDFHVRSSDIRDCAYGPFSFEEAVGEVEFIDCALFGSDGPGYYRGAEPLRFLRCSFGEEESNLWYFREDIEAEDCTWSEITSYPDYSYMEYEEDGGL